MLRHACGYALANKGTDTRTIQDYLGHRSIQHTVRYTKLAPGRFNGLFEDWFVFSSSTDPVGHLTIRNRIRKRAQHVVVV
jgi:hypothetical protein